MATINILIAVLPNGDLASGSAGTIRKWNTNDGTLKTIFANPTSTINAFAVLPYWLVVY